MATGTSRRGRRRQAAPAVAVGGRTALAPRGASDAGIMRVLASALVARSSLAQQAGLTFNGQRNVRETLGYLDKLGYGDYYNRYERDGLARRVVETYPKATWRGGWQLVEDDDPSIVTDFERQWLELEERLRISSVLRRADIVAGIGTYAAVLIGARGEGKLDTEMPRMRSQADVLYLQVYGEGEAKIAKWDEDVRSPRYALPAAYTLARTSRQGSVPMSSSSQRPAHWSRVLHVADGLLEDDVYGAPRLRAVWDRLDDFVKVVGGGSEAFWLRAHQGLFLNVKDAEGDMAPLTPAELADLREAAEELAHQMRRTVAARGVEATTLGSDVANFAAPADALLTVISAITEIPKRLLLGSERGELSSTQDRHNFDSRVADRRLDYAGPQVVRPLADRLIKFGALPEPVSYDIWWPEIMNLSEEERASVLLKYAQANKMNPEGPILSTDELRDRVLDLPPLDEDVLVEQEAETGLPVAALRGLARSKQVLRVLRGTGDASKAARVTAAGLRTAAKRAKKKSPPDTPLSIVPRTGACGGSGA